MKRVVISTVLFILFSEYTLAQYLVPRPAGEDSLARQAEPLAVASIPVPLEPDPFWTSTEANVNSTGMIWRDCNNDGYIDLFIANGNDIVRAQNCIYISNGGNLPRTATWYSSNLDYSGHCAVGDIDDNGYPDFLVSNFLGMSGFSTPNHSELYRNFTGLPETVSGWKTADSMFTFSCALGDVDGDGDLDAAFATGTGYTSTYTTDRIYFNVDGVLQTLPGWQSEDLTAAMDVTWGDVDNDGDLDLAFCYDYDGAAVYYNNAGEIETSPSWRSDEQQAANTLIFGDVNDDGWLDLLVAFNNQLTSGGYFRVYFNDGTGELNTSPGWQSATGGNGSGLALYDYDGDGDDDLAAGRWFDRARIYENIGGTFTSTPVWQANPQTVVEEMAWVDVDADGVEPKADTFQCDGSRKLFYTSRHPLYSLDSLQVDGMKLSHAGYCYDQIDGWISLAEPPSQVLIAHYKYSYRNDLALSHWDTYNMIFGNTFWKVAMYSDVSTGWAPLTVQFYDSSLGATDWLWQFGDGSSSEEQNPGHIYPQGGPYDVSLSVMLADGLNERTIPNMICVLADTLAGQQLTGTAGATVEMTVRGRNCFPLEYIAIPVEYDGPLALEYQSFSTAGCRTEYFGVQDYLHYDIYWGKRVAIRLKTTSGGGQPELPPGDGDIVKLYFKIGAQALPDQSTTILLDGYISGTTTYLPAFNGSIIDYSPAVISGSVSVSCCEGVRGNADGDPENLITIGDIVYLVDWTFTGGPEPACLEEANVDGLGHIDIEDLVYLADYIFKGGPEPAGCF